MLEDFFKCKLYESFQLKNHLHYVHKIKEGNFFEAEPSRIAIEKSPHRYFFSFKLVVWVSFNNYLFTIIFDPLSAKWVFLRHLWLLPSFLAASSPSAFLLGNFKITKVESMFMARIGTVTFATIIQTCSFAVSLEMLLIPTNKAVIIHCCFLFNCSLLCQLPGLCWYKRFLLWLPWYQHWLSFIYCNRHSSSGFYDYFQTFWPCWS